MFITLPALTNVTNGHQKPTVLQTLQDGLNSGLSSEEGGLRAGTPMGTIVIICQ